MYITPYSITVFKGDCGMSLSVFSNANSDGQKELSNVIESVSESLRKDMQDNAVIIPENHKQTNDLALLYNLYDGSDEYFGTLKVIPKGTFAKINKNENQDFPISDQTIYGETYFIFFYPKDKSRRAEHRDNYAIYLDPLKEITKIKSID